MILSLLYRESGSARRTAMAGEFLFSLPASDWFSRIMNSFVTREVNEHVNLHSMNEQLNQAIIQNHR